MFVCLALPTHTISRWVGKFYFFLHLKALYFQTGFSQEHQGRYDINESNLMQHKEQQKTNSIFIKKNIFCLSVRQLNSEIRALSIKSGNLKLNEKQRWFVYCVFYTTQCYRHGMCFRFIHFILISTVHALFLTCLPVSIYGT